MKKELDVAWAAGLFEGEGCVSIPKHRPNQRRLSMNMTDVDVMKKFVDVVGYGNLKGPNSPPSYKEHFKPFYCWQLSKGKEVLRILNLFLPYFGERRSEKAKEAINHLNEIIN